MVPLVSMSMVRTDASKIKLTPEQLPSDSYTRLLATPSISFANEISLLEIQISPLLLIASSY